MNSSYDRRGIVHVRAIRMCPICSHIARVDCDNTILYDYLEDNVDCGPDIDVQGQLIISKACNFHWQSTSFLSS